MSTKKLFLADPYNEDHKRMIRDFEHNNNIDGLFTINTNNMAKDDDENQKSSNDIDSILFLEDSSQIKDMCYIQGVKDMKTCTITFAPISKNYKKRSLVDISTKYALETLSMEEVFISSSPNDKKLIEYLSSSGFEDLGDDKGRVIFLKEKELERVRQRVA